MVYNYLITNYKLEFTNLLDDLLKYSIGKYDLSKINMIYFIIDKNNIL